MTRKPGWNALAYRFHKCLIQLDESPLWYLLYAHRMCPYQTRTWHNWEWSAWLNWSKKLCSLTCDSCTTCTCGCFSGGSLSSCNALASRINLQHALTDEQTWTASGQGDGRVARRIGERTNGYMSILRYHALFCWKSLSATEQCLGRLKSSAACFHIPLRLCAQADIIGLVRSHA